MVSEKPKKQGGRVLLGNENSSNPTPAGSIPNCKLPHTCMEFKQSFEVCPNKT